MASKLILPQAKKLIKPDKPMSIIDEMFANEPPEARAKYDEMVAKFRIKKP